MDDFVILGNDKLELENFRNLIEQFLQAKLKLRLHPKRRKLLPVSGGIDFLGYIVRHNYVLVRRRVVNNFKTKIDQFKNSGEQDQTKIQNTAASYFGHLRWANSYRLKNRFLKRLNLLKTVTKKGKLHD